MTDRPPFEAAHNCICTYPDVPILEFYKGYFDAAYIILHPFYKADEHNKTTQLVSWEEFVSLAGFKDINQLDIALRNNIGGLVKEWENKEDVTTLRNTCKLHGLWMPSEGGFQEAQRIDILTSLQEHGHVYMFVADEFGFERKLAYIQDMIEGKDDSNLTYGGHNAWYTNMNEILYTSHWDSHFTLLCADRETIERILVKHAFEGFYCNEQTEIY